MSKSVRTYEVKNTALLSSHPSRLVLAGSMAQAIRHCSKPFVAELADGARVAELIAAGVELERAGDGEPEPAAK